MVGGYRCITREVRFILIIANKMELLYYKLEVFFCPEFGTD